MVKIATVSMAPVADKNKNLEKYVFFIQEAVKQNVELILFPELSLNGLPPKFSMTSTDTESAYFWTSSAEYVPKGDTTQFLISKAKEYNMYICFDMVEHDLEFSDKYYNTAVLVGPDGREIATTGFDEGMAVAEIEVNDYLQKTFSFSMDMCSMSALRDFRPDVYLPIYEQYSK